MAVINSFFLVLSLLLDFVHNSVVICRFCFCFSLLEEFYFFPGILYHIILISTLDHQRFVSAVFSITCTIYRLEKFSQPVLFSKTV